VVFGVFLCLGVVFFVWGFCLFFVYLLMVYLLGVVVFLFFGGGVGDLFCLFFYLGSLVWIVEIFAEGGFGVFGEFWF